MKGVLIVLFYGMTASAVVVFLFALDIFSFNTITGKGISGNLSLLIEDVSQLRIGSPLNTTYNFNIDEPYTIDLNVSAVFDVVEWKYSLYDLTNEDYIFINQSFSPNVTFNATRWGNRLTVFAQRTDESWTYKEVIFFVSVPNSAPILGYINDKIFVCERRGLYYSFNASDIDRDTLTSDISPKNPFYTNYIGKANETVSLFNIISGTLRKNRVGTSSHTISVNDNYNSSCCIDTKSVNITVIEINNPPVMQGIGAQTVWTQGENSTFYHQMSVGDTEDGVSSSGNFDFNISFSGQENLFGIDNFGIMNYTPEANQVGVYEVKVCVNDNPLEDIHENISLCSPRGGDSEYDCDDFSITVTNQNRIPQIVNYTPVEENFTVSGTDIVSFNIEVYDPDGTIPDIDWYVDGILKQHTEMNSLDSFNYIFGCDVIGDYNVSVIVSDGLLSVSLIWNVTVSLVVCPPIREGGGGGGGGYCIENWACDEWSTCQNLKRSFNIGTIYQKDYYDYNEICLQKGLPEFFCGYQIRNCSDLKECNNSVFRAVKPFEIQVCYFTEEPGCFDEIKNCHSGGCELLVDCGGPCAPCPTCSDKIQNQGEAGIDCGGPCPFSCEREIPFRFNWLLIILLLLLILIVIFIIIKLRNIVRDTKKDKFSLIKNR